MITYWLLFLFPTIAILQPFRADIQLRRLSFILFGIIAVLIIGLRYEVGVDWGTYLKYVERAKGVSFFKAIAVNEPGYMIINWLAANTGAGIAGVNLIGGTVFMLGLLRFSKQQPLPWLALAVATPFLLIVVAMNYSRQAMALGVVLWAFSTWQQKNFVKYSSIIFIAVLFHKSAAVFFALGLFINKKKFTSKWLLAIPLLIFASWHLLIKTGFAFQLKHYIVMQTYHSDGALIRALMNGIPAIILLSLNKRFKQFDDYKLWQMISFASILSIPASLVLSTFTDRLALYLIPIQMVVYCRLSMMVKYGICRSFLVLMIISFYALVLFVWINYAVHSDYWLPYRWIPFS